MPPVRCDSDGHPLNEEPEHTHAMPETSPEEAAWQLFKATCPAGVTWWRHWLSSCYLWPWWRLAISSAERASILQTSMRIAGQRSLEPPGGQDRKDWLAHQVRSDPKALLRHWPEIESIIFDELSRGKYKFARRLGLIVEKSNATQKKLRDALASGDEDAFDRAWRATPLENPGHRGYANEIDRHLVRCWFRDPKEGLPPFCCWSNAALELYFQIDGKPGEDHEGRPMNERFFETRIDALRLIKLPALIVRDLNGRLEVQEPPPVPADDRLRTGLAKLDRELVIRATPDGFAGKVLAIHLLRLDRHLAELDDEKQTACGPLADDLREALSGILAR